MLPDSCVIQSVTRTADSAGGWTESWAAVDGGTVSCRIDPMQTRNAVDVSKALGRETLTAMWQLTTPYDAPIAEDCRVVTGGRT